jgi:hypothetical protein
MSQAYTTRDEWEEFSCAFEQLTHVVTHLRAEQSQQLDHGHIEQFLEKAGRELLRRLLQGHLDYRAAHETGWASLEGGDGMIRSQHREGCETHLATLFGEVIVRRRAYSARGVASLFALDAALNLPPDKYSDGLRCRLAHEVALMSFDEATEQIAHTTGGHIPKRQSEEVVVKVAQDFEAFYAMRQTQGAEASEDLLVLTTDGKGIVMRHEDLREATRKAAARARAKRKPRLSPGEKRQRKRMATVASVYTVAPYARRPEAVMNHEEEVLPRPKVRNKRVWASVARDAEAVIDDLFKEARRRDPTQQRPWVVLVDGEPHQLARIQAAATRHQVSVTIVMDFIHVLEYLWDAARALYPSDAETADAWVRERALKVLQGQAREVAAGMRRSATLRGVAAKQREAVDISADYLLNRQSYLRYDIFLAHGFPMATGVIEGACRHLIKDRMDLTGARWRLKRAEAVLKLRSLCSSGDFEAYWCFHKQQELQRNHLSRYADPLFLDADLAAEEKSV